MNVDDIVSVLAFIGHGHGHDVHIWYFLQFISAKQYDLYNNCIVNEIVVDSRVDC